MERRSVDRHETKLDPTVSFSTVSGCPGLLIESNISIFSVLHQSELIAPKRYSSTICYPSTTIPSSSMASIMKFNSCESAIAFINPRMHAGHIKLHDPINYHMTTHHRSDSIICEFSAV
jgi:hypothetical protein